MEIQDGITVLAALAQETRLRIFRLLVTASPGGLTPGRIGEELSLAPATLSFHLKELSRAGLLSSRQESRFIHYAANYQTINDVIAFLTENCCAGSPCGISSAAGCDPSASSSHFTEESA